MINKVTLIGRLGGDPEIRHLDNGVVVGRFSLATNEYYKDKDGNPQETTEWHNIVVWRDLADRAEKNLKKGSMCYVEGKISYREYKDKDGVDKRITDIVASTFRSLDRREGGADNRFPGAENAPQGRNTNDNGQNQVPTSMDVSSVPGDDLPF